MDDYLNLDVKTLRLFLTVLETGSLTATANQLNVTQSAISHALERLRQIFGDPLFIRSGRGISATPHALYLAEQLKPLLGQLKLLTQPPVFEAQQAKLEWIVAANDFQSELLLPDFYRQVIKQVADFKMTIIQSEVPSINALREKSIDLVLTPLAPDAPDIIQKRLFSDQTVCFYDANARSAPVTEADFRQSHYISLTFLSGKRMSANESSIASDLERNVSVRVPNFSGIAGFLTNTPLLVIAPSLLHKRSLAAFDFVPLPYEPPQLSLYMLWHQRNHTNPSHIWLREQLIQCCERVLDNKSE